MSHVLSKASREAGWVEGDAADFLGLDGPEARLIDLKIAAVLAFRRIRAEKGVNQAQVAKAIGTTQPRIAKLEKFGEGFTLDQIMKALFAVGGSLADVETLPSRPKMDPEGNSAANPGRAGAVKEAANRTKRKKVTAKTR